MIDSDQHQQFEQFCESSGTYLVHKWIGESTNVAVVQLVYHCALYVAPESDGISFRYDHRYCYANAHAALAAIRLFEQTGEWLLWQKDHCNQISVSNGYLYPAGVCHQPEHSVGVARWNEKEVAKGNVKLTPIDRGSQSPGCRHQHADEWEYERVVAR